MSRGEKHKAEFHFLPTGIGSVSSLDVADTCRRILELCPEVPFWPQFVQRSHLEGMILQFSERLPLLEISADRKSLLLSSREPEGELVAFYDRFLAEDIDHFALNKDYAPGLFELVRLIRQHPERYGRYIKGQTVGPITFMAAIRDHQGKSVLHHPELREALVKGLSIRALWQVKELARSMKQPILFLDEPYLSGYGSAFTPLERHDVVSLIKEVMDYLRERSDVLIGIHCCGNTDWAMIVETGPDILSFDAFSYMDHFMLYPGAISRFVQPGGIISWGIVPTGEFAGKASVDSLVSMIEKALKKLEEKGLDPGKVARQSLLTPSCGLGTMGVDMASEVFVLLSLVSKKCTQLA